MLSWPSYFVMHEGNCVIDSSGFVYKFGTAVGIGEFVDIFYSVNLFSLVITVVDFCMLIYTFRQ